VSIYNYNQPGVIDEITFKKTANGAVRAYLHARDGTDAATIQTIQQALREADFECVPYTLGDKPTLEIRNFKKEMRLLKTLGEEEWIKGAPSIKLEKEDQISWWDRFRKRTLQASGLTYVVGDLGFFTYGKREKDPLVVAGAISYFLGTLSLLFYGRNDQSDLQVRDLAKDIEHFVNDQKITLPQDSALHDLTKDKKQSLLEALNDFGRRYPSEIFNTVTALAGVFVATAAYKNKVRFKPKIGMDAKAIREMRQEGWMDLGLGVTTTISGLLATLVKEKIPDPDDPPAKGFAWIWEKIREHPLAISGGGYMVATMCHAGSTWKAYREAKRVGDVERLSSVPGRAVFVAMAFLSEFLLAISSKGHGQGVVSDTSVDDSAVAIAAELILKQPKNVQDNLIQYMGKFLGQPDVLAAGDEDTTQKLRRQVEAMRNNPWAQTTATKNEPHAIATATPKPETPTWQAKLAAKEAAQPQLSA